MKDYSNKESVLMFKTNNVSTTISTSDKLINKLDIKLKRDDYYTIPSIEKLHKYVNNNTCIVPHFTIGRENYGNVYFPDPLDVYGLNLDELVFFQHKKVTIYPDDKMKPPIGQGLNRRAQVTLDCVWPYDKHSLKPIVNKEHLIQIDYEGKLRNVSEKQGTKFIRYKPETGSWVFTVDHFSKYGLDDSDDEDNEVINPQELKKLKITNVPKDLENSMQLSTEDDKFKESHISALDKSKMSSYNLKLQNYDHDMDFEKPSFYSSPTSINARLIGTSSHTLQLMKANFFEFSDENLIQSAIDETKKHLEKKIVSFGESRDETELSMMEHSLHQPIVWPYDNLNISAKETVMNESQKLKEIQSMKSASTKTILKSEFVAPNVQPRVATLHFKTGVAPLKYSIITKPRFKYVADLGIQMGRVFRSSWGPQTTLISLSTQQNAANICLRNTVDQLGSYIAGNYPDDVSSTSIIQRLQIYGGSNLEDGNIQSFKSSIESHLNIELQHSVIEEHPVCPMVTVTTDTSNTDALNAHKTHSLEIISNSDNGPQMTYFCDIWRLCESLWGQLSDIDVSLPKDSHEIVMGRKDALGRWLKLITMGIVQQEIAELKSNEEIIFSLLTGNELEEACNKALESGDHCLALLLSQLGGTLTVRELLKQQIELWQETDVDKNFSIYRLKLFMLVAGLTVIDRNNETINICENLDWRRALAIHLWYISLPTASITDMLDLYEALFMTTPKSPYLALPRPEYLNEEFLMESNNDSSIYDLCYHLIKLYCSKSYPLEAILNPQTYTYDPLDYRLSWLIQQTIIALGYTHVSENVTALTHANFSAQLETFNLWHWAIFVVLHFENPNTRRKAVNDLLLYHVELDKDPSYIEKEQFLEEKLKIPSTWINEAKAIKATSAKRYGEAAWYYIHAQNWNKAHEIIMEHLATEAIINEDYDYINTLLRLMPTSNSNISGWHSQGQLILDYVIITSLVTEVLNQKPCPDIGYKLELLEPQLISLCNRLNTFPCPTSKHTLCQAEMAKRTLQILRGLLVFNVSNSSEILLDLINHLPLPEDYAQQELRPIINVNANNIILN